MIRVKTQVLVMECGVMNPSIVGGTCGLLTRHVTCRDVWPTILVFSLLAQPGAERQ